MYKYASKQEIKNTKTYTESAINSLREPLRKKGYTFSYLLAGSGRRKLVTKNEKTNIFDLDYKMIFKKTKNKNKNIDPSIKGEIVRIMNSVKSSSSKINDSTSSIHYFVINNNGKIIIESEIAIFIEEEDKRYHIKGKGGNYFKEAISYKNNLFEKLDTLNEAKRSEFKKKYIWLKNKDKDKKSFHILLDMLHEI